MPASGVLLCVCTIHAALYASLAAPSRNVVMITVDDLRPQLAGAYGMSETKTPNLDKFAEGALTFQRAYCQMAVCSPSRNSFMSGRRPDTTKVWNFIDHFREPSVGANWTTLPQYFKQQGYFTYASGKLYHPAHPPNDDYPASWTTDANFNPYYWGNSQPIGDAGGCDASTIIPLKATWGSNAVCQDKNDTESLNDLDNKTMPQSKQGVEYDHRLATRTLEAISHAKALGQKFFVGVGFRRPHLAWRHPQRFNRMYDGVAITTAKHQTIGKNITTLAYERNGEMGQNYTDYHGVAGPKNAQYKESPHGPALPAALQAALRRGYYASVSFMDFEVGRVLDHLEDEGVAPSTAVLFHADHGWKLGEHGDWSKCTNWELDARVPLIIRAPWLTASAGKRTLSIAELVDLFPTLVDLAGLPAVPLSEGLQGTSLVPAMVAPAREGAHGKTLAFSQYPRCPEYDMFTDAERYECLMIPKNKIARMGFSVRSAEYRYTQWRIWVGASCSGDWSAAGLVAEELYDHRGDTGVGPQAFDEYEYENLAYIASHAAAVRTLAAALKTQFNHPSPTC